MRQNRLNKISVRLPLGLYEDCREIAEHLGLPYSSMMRMVILDRDSEVKSDEIRRDVMSGIKTERVHIQLNEKELDRVESKSEENSMSTSQYSRIALRTYVKNRED